MIAVDWGTSSFRAYRLDEQGGIVEKRESPEGILSVAPGGFPAVLEKHIAGWGRQPVLMSGMVGSRQGWAEAPYVQCPAGLPEIARRLTQAAPNVWIVPGVSHVDEAGVPDVMRGEETQVLGVLDALGNESLVCLPGTHSKWVRVRGGRIGSFRTYFTGELFAVLRNHSLLGRMMEDGSDDATAFAEGVDRSGDAGGLLHHLFGVRARGLFAELAAPRAPSYLSGLLIGHELRAESGRASIHLLGAPQLAALYERAAALLGMQATQLDSEAAPRGLFAIASKIGL